MHIKKGMLVKIISGNHRGKQGKILAVFPVKQQVIVEGINFVKKATRPTQQNPGGGFIEKEAPIQFSNVMVIQGGKPTRIGYKILDDGTKVRVSKKTGQEIEV
jgi:large subunit ribosomal protein L24